MPSYGLFRKVSLIGVLTTLSRVLGVIRDSVCAAYFGAGMVWDAFSFAFRVPNLFRKLFGEGALRAAFIPVLSDYQSNKDWQEARRLAGTVFCGLGLVLLALLLLGESFVLLAPYFTAFSVRWRLTLGLTAIILPYMLFVCMTAFVASVLHTLKHFAAPALAPVVMNICWIAAVLIFAPLVSPEPTGQILVVAWGIVLAGVLQLVLQLGVLRKLGFKWIFGLRFRHPGLRKIAASMLPMLAGLAAFQLNVLLDGVIAITLSAPEGAESFRALGMNIRYPMTVGANSVLYYGSRLMQFPLGVFGIALATALFPRLSDRAAEEDWEGFRGSFSQALAGVIFIGIPAAVGLAVVGPPVIDLLFERGAFTAEMGRRTASVLLAYCGGVWAFCGYHVLTRSYYSADYMATPAKMAGGAVVINLLLNLTLIWWWGEAGLAAATSVTFISQAGILYLTLPSHLRLRDHSLLGSTLWKSVLATVLMTAVTFGVLRLLPPAPAADRVGLKVLRVGAPVAAGAIAYLGTAALLRARLLWTIGEQLWSRE